VDHTQVKIYTSIGRAVDTVFGEIHFL